MNTVEIYVSKGERMVCFVRLFGEIVTSPFDVTHTFSELIKLEGLFKNLTGEAKLAVEFTAIISNFS